MALSDFDEPTSRTLLILGTAIPTLAWLQEKPRVSIESTIRNAAIEISACAYFGGFGKIVWKAMRILPLTVPMSTLRDAYDELTREGHLALEKQQGIVPNSLDWCEACKRGSGIRGGSWCASCREIARGNDLVDVEEGANEAH